jgi:formamidopyrimidine-DNA glycosylase
MSAFEADRFNHSRTSPRQASFQYNSIRQAVWERISVPELPDVVVYIEALEQRILGHVLERAEVRGPFLLRTADPPLEAAHGHTVTALRRIGKRIAIGFDNDLWLVVHLMIAGRLHWSQQRKAPDGKRTLAAFHFDSGTLTLTEAGSRKRASLHLVVGEVGLARLDPGGIDVLSATLDQFTVALTSENHTLKRSLTDPRLFSGIGNAYSDEILYHAQLSPIALTQKLSREQIARLFEATRSTLSQWIEIHRARAGSRFPEKVTAFHEQMAVHGRHGKPCPRCGTKVQRIRYASNETNYCPHCQTGGKLLADRALSRLLREDWPRTLEELEERRRS